MTDFAAEVALAAALPIAPALRIAGSAQPSLQPQSAPEHGKADDPAAAAAAAVARAQNLWNARRRTRIALLALVAGVTFVLDVVAKVVVVAWLDPDSPVEVPGVPVTLRLIRNPGAAFGIGVDLTALFTLITVGVIAVIAATSWRLGSLRWAATLGLLLGGALGNLTDRLARSPGFLHGHVIDFVEIPGWPIFNVADAAIVVAGLLMITLAVRNVPLAGHRPRPRG
ncbi:MAG: signal peptidase II [Sporichthyaceae bacterium]